MIDVVLPVNSFKVQWCVLCIAAAFALRSFALYFFQAMSGGPGAKENFRGVYNPPPQILRKFNDPYLRFGAQEHEAVSGVMVDADWIDRAKEEER